MDTSSSAPSFSSTNRKIVMLPIGSCEQHGPYLPIDTDLRIANLIATQIAHSFSPDDVVLLPPIPYSCSYEHHGLGTLAIRVGTLSQYIHDIAYSLKQWGVPLLLILINWHGGNDLLGALATEISVREGIPCAAIPSTSQVGKSWDESGITAATDVHAGAIETSIIQAYWPELMREAIPPMAHDEPVIAPAKVQPVLQALGSYTVTRSGVWGAPEQADADRGKVLIVRLVDALHDQIAGLFALVNTYNK